MGKESYIKAQGTPEEAHMATDLDTRIKILGELYASKDKFPNAKELFDANDVGIPYAFLVASGITIMLEESSGYIKDSWISFCEYLNLDPRATYTDLNDLLDKFILIEKIKSE